MKVFFIQKQNKQQQKIAHNQYFEIDQCTLCFYLHRSTLIKSASHYDQTSKFSDKYMQVKKMQFTHTKNVIKKE